MLACLFFATQSDQFLEPRNFSLIIQQVMVVGTLAIGQTLIILTAGIDLSCGTAMALGSIVMTKMAVDNGVPPLLAILLGVATCMLVGFVNGGLVVGLSDAAVHRDAGHVQHLLRAHAHLLQGRDDLEPPERDDQARRESFNIGDTAVTYGSLVTLGLFALFWFLLTQTTWGRRVYASATTPRPRA